MRGIALISAIMLVGFMLALLGAFLQVNRGQVWLLNAGEGRQRAYAACQAGYQYLTYRLELDRTFAAADFAGGTDTDSQPDLAVEEVAGTRTVTGTLASLEGDFKAEIFNNLAGTAINADGVPPNCARLHIWGNSSGHTREVTCLLHVAPLYDASAVTHGQVTMGVDQFNIRSRDPWRNQIRAEKSVAVPNVLTASKTQSLKVDSNEKDPKGLFWSKSNILSDSTAVDGSNVADANSNSGGVFVPQAQQHFDIYDLKPDSIVLPENSTNMPAGRYAFAQASAQVTVKATYSTGGLGATTASKSITTAQTIQVLEYYAHADDTVPTKVFRSANRTDDLDIPKKTDIEVTVSVGDGGTSTTTTPAGLTGASVTNLVITYPHGQPGEVIIGDVATLDDQNHVRADLYSQQVTIDPNTNVVVGGGDTGGLTILSERGGQPPTLNLGTPDARAAILANDTINLSADRTEGVGSLVSKSGDVVLKPSSQNLVVDGTNPSTGGLVLYGNNVTCENPATGGTWDFKGLVYARNDFTFKAQGANSTVEGAVVALNGNINFDHGAQVDFVYNPAYLTALVKALPQYRTKLERLYWRD